MSRDPKPPFSALADLDRVVHEPARLAIMTALGACRHADFLYLQRLTGLTKGNLSSHLAKLEDAGLVSIEKSFQGKTPNTQLALTPEGRRVIERHWKKLEQLRASVLEWQPEG